MMTSVHVTTKYIDDEVYFQLGRYQDNSIAIKISLAMTGEPMGVATVCLAQYKEKPAEGNVFIKDWGENEGMLKGLQDAEIVGEVVREIPAGRATAYEVPFLLKPDDSKCRML